MSNMKDAPDAVGRESEAVREEARKVAGTFRDEASNLASSLKEKVEAQAKDGITVAATSLEDFTAAIRKASDELGARGQSMVASMVRQAASGLEDASSSIKGKSLGDITHSLAGFARQQPAAFLIGAVLAGVAIGRFAKASGDHSDAERHRGARPGSGVPNAAGERAGSTDPRDPAYSTGTAHSTGLRDTGLRDDGVDHEGGVR